MTKKEFFASVANGEISEEAQAMAAEELKKLNERSEKSQQKNAPIKEAILVAIPSEGATSSEIAELVGISTNKAASLCRQLAEADFLRVEEVKIPKKGKCKKYWPIESESEEDNE